MRIKRTLSVIVLSLTITSLSKAQTTIDRNVDIAEMVSEISSDSLEQYIHDLVSFGTRSTLSTQHSDEEGIGAARNYVLQKFNQFAEDSDGRFTAYIDTVTLKPDGSRIDRPVLLGNVMGVLKGVNADDDRVFIMSGHLDSRRIDVMDSVKAAPGANDDGSGVAALLESARIMSKKKFSGTIIFVAVSGEEQGLLGSKFLAEKAKEEGWNVEAMLNDDMIGNNNSSETNVINNTRLRVFSEGIPHYETEKAIRRIISLGLENDGNSRQLARYVKEVGERYVDHLDILLQYRSDRFLRGGDHLPFLQNGFTAVRITDMHENYLHQHENVRVEDGVEYGDLPKFMDFEYLRKTTAVNLSVLANLANSVGIPQNAKIEVKGLTNKTTLRWEAPKYGQPKGYYVLMRPTAESMWTKKFFTTDTEFVLPYSKDNYFFAIQSVNDAGNESLVAVPMPW